MGMVHYISTVKNHREADTIIATRSWSVAMETPLRGSCQCGNIIYGIGDTNPELAKLQAGTLEDTRSVEPDVHMWTCRKQPWVSLPEGASVFETQPEDAAALFQAALDYRARKQASTS